MPQRGTKRNEGSFDDVAKENFDPNEELVEYIAPIDPKGEARDIVVAVNGEMIRIQRGRPVKIKRKFLKALQNADEQNMVAYRTMENAAKQSAQPTAEI